MTFVDVSFDFEGYEPKERFLTILAASFGGTLTSSGAGFGERDLGFQFSSEDDRANFVHDVGKLSFEVTVH